MVEVVTIAEVRVKYTPRPRYGLERDRRSFRVDLFVGAVEGERYTELTIATSNGNNMGRTDSPFYLVRCQESPAEIEAAVKEGMIIFEALQSALKGVNHEDG